MRGLGRQLSVTKCVMLSSVRGHGNARCMAPRVLPHVQAAAQGVTSEELERAKRAAIASVYMNLESRAVVAEDIGRQIFTYGHR